MLSVGRVSELGVGSVPTRGNRNSDGWQKCFTNVPPGASRISADHNVKNVFSSLCDAVDGEYCRWLYGAKHRRSGRGASLTTVGVSIKTRLKTRRGGPLASPALLWICSSNDILLLND